jgi:adenosylhomocysteine nucleosidase
MSLKVGIVSAMQREVGPMLKHWQEGLLEYDGRKYTVWRTVGAVYIESGIGHGPAIFATRALVGNQRPDILVSAGFAGALTRLLTVGESIAPGTVIDASTGKRFNLHSGTGVLVSASVIADEAEKTQLAARYGAQAVDMEAAAVAQVAEESGLPFCAVKTISDELGFPLPPLKAYVSDDGQLEMGRFAANMAIRPGYWPSLMQLARNSKKASAELSSALEQLLGRLAGQHAGTDLQVALRDVGVSSRGVN